MYQRPSGRTSRLYRDGPGIVGYGHCYGVLIVHVGRVLVLLVAGDLDLWLFLQCELSVYGTLGLCRGIHVRSRGGQQLRISLICIPSVESVSVAVHGCERAAVFVAVCKHVVRPRGLGQFAAYGHRACPGGKICLYHVREFTGEVEFRTFACIVVYDDLVLHLRVYALFDQRGSISQVVTLAASLGYI